jgi:hypothetical protein
MTFPSRRIDIVEALHRESENLRLSGDVEGTARINFDGVLVTNREDFFQLYRSGSTLEVDSGELTTDFEGSRNTNESIGATELDRAIFKGVGRRLALLKSLGVTSPVLVSISLLGVKGCNLSVRALFYVGDSPGGYRHSLSRHRIDRPNLFLSGLVIENLQELPLEGFRGPVHDNVPRYWEVVQSLLRPYCDSIWNAFGYPRSTYFDPEGKWLGQVSREARA